MNSEEMARDIARAMEAQNKAIIQNMINPGAVVVVPDYLTWRETKCPLDGDDSMEQYWRERRQAIRMFALDELDGGDCGRGFWK